MPAKKKIDVTEYSIVEVVWVDAEEKGDVGWNEVRAQLRYAKTLPPVMHTVGYLVHQCESHVSLLSTIGQDECSTLEKIPAGFIKRITTLIPEKTKKG
jgi:hypothetical protein